MSVNTPGNEGTGLNSNNSSKTPGADGTFSNDDASSNFDGVEEIPCLMETVTPGRSEQKQDVYEPNANNTESMEPQENSEEKGDKWASPSPHKPSQSQGTVENDEFKDEDVKVELPPLAKDNSDSEQTNKSSGDRDVSSCEKPSSDPPSSVEDSNNSVALTSGDKVSAKRSQQDGDHLSGKKQSGAETVDSLKPDVVDNVENRSSSPMDDRSSTGSLEGVYQIKWIKFKGSDVPIITQNENGPCPLLALMNVLLLKGKIKFPSDTEIVSSEQIMAHLGEYILANKPQNVTEVVQLNYEQNMHDAMAVFHKLQTGLDVNVRFHGVSEFEYTPECIIFDLLGISLYHGWLVDPQNHSEVSAIGTCSYNQLVEKIISQRSSDSSDKVTEALVAEGFLDRTASQLTYHGLCELSSTIKPEQLCVFFRNNHFCTLYRHKEELFLLVTDQGFLHERNVVWETLNNVEGDHYFVDSDFHTYTKPAPVEAVLPPDVPVNSDEQVNHDYLLAMSLQQEQQIAAEQMEVAEASHQRGPLSDAELAARLQAEEDAQAAHQASQQPHPHHHGNQRGPPAGYQGQQRSRERERRERDRHRDRSKDKDSSCTIL